MNGADNFEGVVREIRLLDNQPHTEYFFVAIDTLSLDHQVCLICSKLGRLFITCSKSIEKFKEFCTTNRLDDIYNEHDIIQALQIPKETPILNSNPIEEGNKRSSRYQRGVHNKGSSIFVGNNALSHETRRGYKTGIPVSKSDMPDEKENGVHPALPVDSGIVSFHDTQASHVDLGPQHECQKCFKNFESLIELESHLETSHHAQLHYKCNVCKRKFRTKHRFKVHVHKVKGCGSNEGERSNRRKDDLCHGIGQQTREQDSIEDPSVNKSEDMSSSFHQGNTDTTVCRMCFIKFNTSSERQFHEDNEHNVMAKSGLLDGITSELEIYDEATRVLVIKRHQCKVCSKRFLSAVELRRHGYLHGDDGKISAMAKGGDESVLKCSECPLIFTNPIYLRNHRYTHFQVARFKCPECPRRFKRRCHLAEHRNVHRDIRPYACVECGRSFKLESCLRSHMAVHRKDTPHQCSECGKQFKRAASLRQHAYTHGERIYPCTECDKKFAVPHNLRAHVAAVHRVETAGEARNSCDKCGKSFKRARNLKLHLRSHDPSSMLPCPLCPKRYTRSADLKLHLVSHGEKRPFVCDACHQTFKTPSNMRRHSLVHCRFRAKTGEAREGVLPAQSPHEPATLCLDPPQQPQWQEPPVLVLSDREYHQTFGLQQPIGFLQLCDFQQHAYVDFVQHVEAQKQHL